MWKLLKYEFRRARTSLLTVLGVIAVILKHEILLAIVIWSTSSLRRC